MSCTRKTETDLKKWEKDKGFKGVISEGGVKIRRKCVNCDQPTRCFTEEMCSKHGGKGQAYSECQTEGCTNKAYCANGTMCVSCWVAADPEARSCPGCQKLPKRQSRPDGLCCNCVRKAAVEAKREARRPELAQMCEEQGIEEGPADATDAAFGTRYAVLNFHEDYKPHVVVRSGDQWTRACAVRGCTHMAIRANGTPNTHCIGHGGGPRCAVEGMHLARGRRAGLRAVGRARALRRSARSTACPNPSGRGRAAAWAACSGSSRRTRPSRCTCARRT